MSSAESSIELRTFLLSLASNAMLQLGAIPDPETNESTINLPLARQSIDILSMLRDKTTGNLTDEEEELFENLLYDLRLRYIEKTSEAGD
jgi:hypothetical protein